MLVKKVVFLGKNPAGQHSPGRTVGEKCRFVEKKSPRQGNTHPDAMWLFIDASICMHMYAYCTHIDENCIEMLKNVAMLLNLMFFMPRMIFFRKLILVLLRSIVLDRSQGPLYTGKHYFE